MPVLSIFYLEHFRHFCQISTKPFQKFKSSRGVGAHTLKFESYPKLAVAILKRKQNLCAFCMQNRQ